MKPELILLILFVIDTIGFIYTSETNRGFCNSKLRYIPFTWILF